MKRDFPLPLSHKLCTSKTASQENQSPKLVLAKHEVDSACKNSRFRDDFKLAMHFDRFCDPKGKVNKLVVLALALTLALPHLVPLRIQQLW